MATDSVYHGKTVLLTGGTGFLGAHLVRFLVESTDLRLILVTRPSSDLSRLTDLMGKERVVEVKIGEGDLESVFDHYAVTAVIHAATDYGREPGSTPQVLEANLVLPIRLLELAIQFGVKSFLNFDTYYSKNPPISSQLVCYTLSKNCILQWLKGHQDKIQVTNICLEHVYGEYDSSSKFVEKMIRAIAIERVDSVSLTEGLQKRDFVYIDDVVRAVGLILREAISQSYHFRNYEVGTGKGVSIRDFVETIKRVSQSSTRLGFGKVGYAENEIMASRADISELACLGWNCEYTPDAGISRIIGQYRLRPPHEAVLEGVGWHRR